MAPSSSIPASLVGRIHLVRYVKCIWLLKGKYCETVMNSKRAQPVTVLCTIKKCTGLSHIFWGYRSSLGFTRNSPVLFQSFRLFLECNDIQGNDITVSLIVTPVPGLPQLPAHTWQPCFGSYFAH